MTMTLNVSEYQSFFSPTLQYTVIQCHKVLRNVYILNSTVVKYFKNFNVSSTDRIICQNYS